MFDFFYGKQPEAFSFYQVPKVLFQDQHFHELTMEGKILYAVLLDRMSLSVANGWKDELGRVYIIFTVEDLMRTMGCSDRKVTKMTRELEQYGLIERKRLGQGRPNIIYVKNFISGLECGQNKRIKNRKIDPSKPEEMEESGKNVLESEEYQGFGPEEPSQKRRNGDCRISDLSILESPKLRCNHTETSDTEFSDTETFSSSPSAPPSHGTPAPSGNGRSERMGSVSQEMFEQNRELVRYNIGYHALLDDYGVGQELLDEMVELIAEVVSIQRPSVRISGFDYPYSMVRDRFWKLNMSHIQYVLDCMSQNTTQVRNAKQYLLTVLFNAPVTMETHTMAQVKHDMCC